MSELQTLRRVRLWTGIFIAGLVISGVTAIPVISELNWLLNLLGDQGSVMGWLSQVRDALVQTDAAFPYLAYGYDWLAFGHFVIALAFVGAWRDPVRNIWLFQFGMLACLLVVPYALVWGAVREIPLAWRLVDSMFGVLGMVPMVISYRLSRRLEQAARSSLAPRSN